eukprot:8179650-Pyramimonas_sp.AAC.1
MYLGRVEFSSGETLNKGLTANSPVVERLSKGLMANSPVVEWLIKNKGLMASASPTRSATLGKCEQAQIFAGKFNSPVVERLNKGLMDNPQLWHFFGARKDSGGELNSPV